MNPIMQGIILFVVGMAVLFAAMALVILAIILLRRLFPPLQPVPVEQKPEAGETVEGTVRVSEEEEIVAAIAVALAHLRSLKMGQAGLGTALEAGRGPWWTEGRIQQHGRR